EEGWNRSFILRRFVSCPLGNPHNFVIMVVRFGLYAKKLADSVLAGKEQASERLVDDRDMLGASGVMFVNGATAQNRRAYGFKVRGADTVLLGPQDAGRHRDSRFSRDGNGFAETGHRRAMREAHAHHARELRESLLELAVQAVQALCGILTVRQADP